MREAQRLLRQPVKIAMIGYGAIGSHVFRALRDDPLVRIEQIILPPAFHGALRAQLGEAVEIVADSSQLSVLPDFAIECAGHEAVREHVIALLQAGVDSALVSVGSLADAQLFDDLLAAAEQGGARLQLLAGAIGAVDALAAAKEGGLDSVLYEGTKPPHSWIGTPAADHYDLSSLLEPTILFEGTAREAARAYPKNANVAATVALAGIGFDQTRVRLTADPAIKGNQHRVQAQGAFGEFNFQMIGKALPDNPKTSALAALSAIRALRHRSALYTI